MIISSKPSIAVVCFSKQRLQQAKDFCRSHDLPLVQKKEDRFELQLVFHDDIIELYDSHLSTSISIDFVSGALAHRQQFGGGRGQAIAKAIGLKPGITPTVLDATAGLAGDAFVLACLGCPITLLERSPILFTLIENAIERAQLSEAFQPIVTQGFKLENCDANDYIETQLALNNHTQPDVIYIDPMYPERKKSALVKKDMQILQRLHGEQDDAEKLLTNALRFANKRVVVKRPINAKPLSAKKPNTCIKSKKTRYDIYALAKM